MAGGEAVRLRRTASLGRLLKMRDESLREEILGLCWMGGQMSCAEQCNMGSRGRGTRRTSRSDEAGCESEGADVHAPSGSEKKRRRKQKEKRKKIENRTETSQRCTTKATRGQTQPHKTPHMLHFLFGTRAYLSHMASIQTHAVQTDHALPKRGLSSSGSAVYCGHRDIHEASIDSVLLRPAHAAAESSRDVQSKGPAWTLTSPRGCSDSSPIATRGPSN